MTCVVKLTIESAVSSMGRMEYGAITKVQYEKLSQGCSAS